MASLCKEITVLNAKERGCDTAEGRKSRWVNEAVLLTFCSAIFVLVCGDFMCDDTCDGGFLEDFTRIVHFRQPNTAQLWLLIFLSV